MAFLSSGGCWVINMNNIYVLLRRAWLPVIMPVLASAHLIGGAVMLGLPVDQAMGLVTLIFGFVILFFWLRRAYPDSESERRQYRGYQPEPYNGEHPVSPPNQPSAVRRVN